MFTNTTQFGGKFERKLDFELRNAQCADIATGYVGKSTILNYEAAFRRMSNLPNGHCKILLGMAFFEGLSSSSHRDLSNLHNTLSSNNLNSGIYLSYSQKYHGKIYNFSHNNSRNIYLGSSNFSQSGLSSNIECTIEVTDNNQKTDLITFTNYLFDPSNAVSINKANIPIHGRSRTRRGRTPRADLSQLQRHQLTITQVIQQNTPYFDFDLRRIADKQKSSLNTYFGKGRVNRNTGVVTPRGWYEVELIADDQVRASVHYPKGNFQAYTNDGYIIPMKTQGDYYKNIRSEGMGRGTLHVFGMWIKGKLEQAGALETYQPIDLDTFNDYGRSNLRFYKLSPTEYYLDL